MATSGDVELGGPSSIQETETSKAEQPTPSNTSYSNFSHHCLAARLEYAKTTNKIGTSRPDTPPSPSSVHAIVQTLPWRTLLVQAAWSTVVTAIAWGMGNQRFSTLTRDFWDSRFFVPSSVAHAVGWALFVLLGFFVREAAQRHREASIALGKTSSLLYQLMRQLKHAYHGTFWPTTNRERIAAHLVAYPIALKMELRGEKNLEQFHNILCEDDIQQVSEAHLMHIHCLRTVRAYIAIAEHDGSREPTHAGLDTRCLVMEIPDAIEKEANLLLRIKDFKPAKGYLSHLRIFLAIWLFFLPLSTVRFSGWFTVLWSLLITYGISMLYLTAVALNEPYGYDPCDIELNKMCANASLMVLNAYSRDKNEIDDVVKDEYQIPHWIEMELPSASRKTENKKGFFRAASKVLCDLVGSSLRTDHIRLPLLAFTMWVAFLVFLSWGITRGTERSIDCRWWCVYIPIDSSTTAYVGLAVFLVIGFWLLDAHGRYWQAVQLMHSQIRTGIETVAINFGTTCRKGLWHEQDRRRIFAHLAAIPYAAKQDLRGTRERKEIETVLSPDDCDAMFKNASLALYCFNVLHGYYHSAERRCKRQGQNESLGFAFCSIEHVLWEVEFNALGACQAIKANPLPRPFTLHLWVFGMIWLAILPPAFFSYYGFLSFLFLIPIAFSFIHMLSLGQDLNNPFAKGVGSVPMNAFCDETRFSIHNIYAKLEIGLSSLEYDEEYQEASFRSKLWSLEQFLESGFVNESQKSVDGASVLTFRNSLQVILARFPAVSWKSQLLISIWSIMAVFASYGLSYAWDDSKRNECKHWCSPIDVNNRVLLEMAFALFLILSFRASDGINRYEEGALLFYDVEMHLRAIAVEFTQTIYMSTPTLHRIISHLVQVPISFLAALRGSVGSLDFSILGTTDKKSLLNSDADINHCLQVLESYVLSAQSKRIVNKAMLADFQSPNISSHAMLWRLSQLRSLTARAVTMKRYPVVKSFTRLQRALTAIWLILLPFGITPDAGFYTILLTPLISYGVLGLEEIAISLMDPFGTDFNLDLPVEEMCAKSVRLIIQGARSMGWTTDFNTSRTQLSLAPTTCAKSQKDQAQEMLQEDISDFHHSKLLLPDSHQVMTSLSLYAHFLKSVPWWVLFASTGWGIIAISLSYGTRSSESGRWWATLFVVDGTVGSFLSFSAFTLLGFYASTAFGRYHEAGSVWGDNLRASCHTLCAQLLTLFPPHSRFCKELIRYIASIPVALKMETRGLRDISELKGLLCPADIGKMHCAESMSNYCLDVLRSNFYSATPEKQSISQWSKRMAIIKIEIMNLERATRSCLFLRQFEISPGFVMLLRTLLILWFVFLPFIIAENSGWFGILWTVIIAYGVFGMYSVAKEVQMPFGSDLNDLDLDTMADEIVQSVLDVYQNSKGENKILVGSPDSVPSIWQDKKDGSYSTDSVNVNEEALDKVKQKVGRKNKVLLFLQRAIRSVPWWLLPAVTLWSTACVSASWLVARHFPVLPERDCSPAWCSAIAVDGQVSEYISYALFLLLGIRLYDSHWRYVSGLTIWREGIIGTTRLLANRLFSAFSAGTWHEGDVERLASHLAAFSVVTVERLRRQKNCSHRLKQIMCHDDILAIERMDDKPDYCLDVVRAYLVHEENKRLEGGADIRVGRNEHQMILHYLNTLKDHAAKCERMIRVPLPYGYVQHIRIFIVIWLMILPFGLVESTGWFTILWVVLIAFGVVGLEHWATELADPFGYDESDIDLEALQQEAIDSVRINLNVFRSGAGALVHRNRSGLV